MDQRLRIRAYLLVITAIQIVLLQSCRKHNDKTPEEDPYKVFPISQITDAIPFDALGSGKIVFRRLSVEDSIGINIIDIDKKKVYGFALNSYPWPAEPNISPDGTKIACSMFTVKTAVTIDIMKTDGSDCFPVRSSPRRPHYPSWTPDGSKVIYYEGDYGESFLYIQSAVENANDSAVMINFRYEDDPEFFIFPSGGFSISPEQRLVCVSYGNKLRGILGIEPYVGKSGITTLLPLSAVESFESPVFAPDGQKIAFLSIAHDSLDSWRYNSVAVKTMNPDGTNVSQLVTIDAYEAPVQWAYQMRFRNVSLCWSPDGSRILFTVPLEEFGCHLFVINSDGSGLTQVTDDINGYDVDVSWGR